MKAHAVATAEPPRNELNDLALESLGGGAPWQLDQVEGHLDALEVDLDVLHLAMTSDQCEAFAINNYVLRLISRVRLIREIHRTGGA